MSHDYGARWLPVARGRSSKLPFSKKFIESAASYTHGRLELWYSYDDGLIGAVGLKLWLTVT